MRYCGSPLAYSFSEADQHKGSWLVDLDADGQVTTEFVDAPVPRPLARLRGTLDDAADRSPPAGTPRQRGCRPTLTDTERPAQAKPRLERRFPHLLSVNFEPEGASRGPAARRPHRRRAQRPRRSPSTSCVTCAAGRPTTAESQLLLDACDACGHDPDADLVVHA